MKLDRHVKKVLRGKLGNQHKRVTIEYIDCRPSSHEPARDESGFRTMKIKMIRCHAACLASNLMQDNQVRRSDRLKEAAAKAQDNLIAPFKATALPRRNPGFPPKKNSIGTTEVDASDAKRSTNRHRGSGHPPSPATPPYMRVRIRRFRKYGQKRPGISDAVRHR